MEAEGEEREEKEEKEAKLAEPRCRSSSNDARSPIGA